MNTKDKELREKVDNKLFDILNRLMIPDSAYTMVNAYDAILNLIEQEKIHQKTIGHRMESYIEWTGYIRFCESHKCMVNLNYAYGLYRRFNELTDMANNETGSNLKNNQYLVYYDMDFNTGKVLGEISREDWCNLKKYTFTDRISQLNELKENK